MLSSFDNPQLCPNCLGYKTMPYTWNSTFAPRMCSCPVNPRYDLAWECPRCKKINAPWKDSCSCTPSNINWSTASDESYIGGADVYYNDPEGPRPSSHDLNKNFTDK